MGLIGAESSRKQESTKERKNVLPLIILFFGSDCPYNKIDLTQHAFIEDLVLYIAKRCCLMSSIKNH